LFGAFRAVLEIERIDTAFFATGYRRASVARVDHYESRDDQQYCEKKKDAEILGDHKALLLRCFIRIAPGLSVRFPSIKIQASR
jgi:hypothetical protein